MEVYKQGYVYNNNQRNNIFPDDDWEVWGGHCGMAQQEPVINAHPKSQYACEKIIKLAQDAGFIIGAKVSRKNCRSTLENRTGIVIGYEYDYLKAYRAYGINGYDVVMVKWEPTWDFAYDPDELTLVTDEIDPIDY